MFILQVFITTIAFSDIFFINAFFVSLRYRNQNNVPKLENLEYISFFYKLDIIMVSLILYTMYFSYRISICMHAAMHCKLQDFFSIPFIVCF